MKKVGKIEISKQAVTPTMLTSLFENMKDFVQSAIKANNVSIRKEIDAAVDPLKSDVKQVQVAVLENRKEIKRVEKELREEIKGVRTELKQEISDVRTELKQEIHDSEERLGNKIDKNAIRLGDHETRITHLEEAR